MIVSYYSLDISVNDSPFEVLHARGSSEDACRQKAYRTVAMHRELRFDFRIYGPEGGLLSVASWNTEDGNYRLDWQKGNNRTREEQEAHRS